MEYSFHIVLYPLAEFSKQVFRDGQFAGRVSKIVINIFLVKINGGTTAVAVRRESSCCRASAKSDPRSSAEFGLIPSGSDSLKV